MSLRQLAPAFLAAMAAFCLLVNLFLGFHMPDPIRNVRRRSHDWARHDESMKEKPSKSGNQRRAAVVCDKCLVVPPENQTLFVPSSSVQLFTRQGPSHKENQDRIFYMKPFLRSIPSSWLTGIFDGHGVQGHLVADYVLHHFPTLLAKALEPALEDVAAENINHTTIQQALIYAVEQADRDIPSTIALRGGCTASVTLQLFEKSYLYFANTGDSRTMLVSFEDDQAASIVYQTRLDKPHLPEERARIERMGGTIHTPPQHPAGARVTVFSHAAGETIALAMSRSLGDWEWKPGGVIATPTVQVLEAPPGRSLVLAASDGLWDLRQPPLLARRFAHDILGAPREQKALEAFVHKIAPTKGYLDDISIALVPL